MSKTSIRCRKGAEKQLPLLVTTVLLLDTHLGNVLVSKGVTHRQQRLTHHLLHCFALQKVPLYEPQHIACLDWTVTTASLNIAGTCVRQEAEQSCCTAVPFKTFCCSSQGICVASTGLSLLPPYTQATCVSRKQSSLAALTCPARSLAV